MSYAHYTSDSSTPQLRHKPTTFNALNIGLYIFPLQQYVTILNFKHNCVGCNVCLSPVDKTEARTQKRGA